MRATSLALAVVFGWASCLDGAPVPDGNPRLTFIGHATVLLEGNETTLLTDPFFKPNMLWLKRRVLPSCTPAEIPPLDAVLISHTHPDHFDTDALQKLNPRPVVLMPWGRGGTLRSKGFTVISLRPGERWVHKKTVVTAVHARHNAWHNVGYLIEMDGKKIYFTGDTKLFDELKTFSEKAIDLMLMPYAGTPVIGNIWTMEDAAQAVAWVKPKICIPIHMETFGHWVTGRPSAPPEQFRDFLSTRAPETKCVVLRPGDIFPW